MVPYFPKRAVVTCGMPYGSKNLHFGHVGGCFVHADIYARFLRDRIGKDNVIFVSGTDCYGAGIEVKYHEAQNDGYQGTITDFVEGFHKSQKKTLEAYGISLDLYGASALYEGGRLQEELSVQLFETWYNKGFLRLEEVEQFYDNENQVILNGRQVEGRCPIAKCKSDTAYADECELGHQYSPTELISPKIVTTGKTPSLKAVKNWYFDMERFNGSLKERQKLLEEEGISRKFLLSNVADFLKDPTILVKTEDFETLGRAITQMPGHSADIDEEKQSAVLTFKVLKDREAACKILREHGIRFRTGTTLVPFRLTGNVKWGIPTPEKDGVSGQTFWCWPESLWIPIAFTQAYLLERYGTYEGWEKYWYDSNEANGSGKSANSIDSDKESSRVYQFIGEDNIYFYAVAWIGMVFALNEIEGRPTFNSLPRIVPNRHLFYGNRKAATSGDIKPPSADELLDYYTPEQLRMHFAHMALGANSVAFKPMAILDQKPSDGLVPSDKPDNNRPDNNKPIKKTFDPTLAEGNILTNVYNRLIRSCFYTMQKHFNGKLPLDHISKISKEDKEAADTLITEYEWAMYRFEFPKIIDMLDVYLRDANKAWSANTKTEDTQKLGQALLNGFHVVRVTATLLHPFAPEGTERVREFLGIDESLWDWCHIREPLTFFIGESHSFKFLEPRVDFFFKHPSQLSEN